MRERVYKYITLLIDVTVMAIVMLALPTLSGYSLTLLFPWAHPIVSFVVIAMMAVFLLDTFGAYRNRWSMSLPAEVFCILKGMAIVSLVVVVAYTFVYTSEDLSIPVFILNFYAVSSVLLISERTLLFLLHNLLAKRGVIIRRTILIGTGDKVDNIITKLKLQPSLGLKVVAQIAAADDATNSSSGLRTIDELRDTFIRQNADNIMVAEYPDEDLLNAILVSCVGLRASIYVIPSAFEIGRGKVKIWRIGSLPLIELSVGTSRHRYMRYKRAIDMFAAAIFLLLSLPIWLVLLPLILIQTKGSLLFSQDRVGKDGKCFTMYKFRSMVASAEDDTGPVWAGENDTRIVPIGRLIRKLRIDEIPQFLNVLKGDMSIIGPRPERPFFVEQFTESVPFYTRRISIKPGISGWAQVQHKYDETLDDVKEKLNYDLYYIDNMCLSLDVEIFFRTIWVILVGKGAR